MKEEGRVLSAEGGESRGARLPRVNEDMTPWVPWILGLNLHTKCSQRITGEYDGKSGEGQGEAGSGEKGEG